MFFTVKFIEDEIHTNLKGLSGLRRPDRKAFESTPQVGDILNARFDDNYYPAEVVAVGTKAPKLTKKQMEGKTMTMRSKEEKVRVRKMSPF